MTTLPAPRRRAALLALALLVPTALTLLAAAPAAARDDPRYCESNPADPRCKPDYCEHNPNDAWCWDERYCERNPDDPICRKEAAKETCVFEMAAAPAVAGASPGPAVVTLTCPHHLLAGWECGWKDGRSLLPVPDPTPSDPLCTSTGKEGSDPDPANPDPCKQQWTWTVARPDARTVTAWLRADMWKDADCDGKPDDWNATLADGTCLHPNKYGPKTGSPSYPYAPKPDGKIDECDQQHYEWQWRQFN